MRSQGIYRPATNYRQPVAKGGVFVGLSGGVDSSVSAALLKKQGYDVTGVFIKIWSPDWLWCASKEDRLDAMRVCAKLDIPFREIDLTKEYKKEVVDYMIREYKVGRTPNPDVFCNRYIKFGAFFDWARKHGADYIATGHYARRVECSKQQVVRTKNGRENIIPATYYSLHTANDKNKDQTYFLWTLTQRELSQTLFPIGHLTKPEVRKIAKKLGLPTAEKKDSQGLCFVGPVDVKEFLRQYIAPKRGNVLNIKGEIIGWHDGAELLTLGERRGFSINQKTPDGLPYYVVAKDIKKNTITVSQPPNLGVQLPSERILSKVNWIAGAPPNFNKTYFARFRYRQPLVKIGIGYKKSPLIIQFSKPQTAIAPGQSLVIYTKTGECLGGGIIE